MARSAEEVLKKHFPGFSPEEVDRLLTCAPSGARPLSAAATSFLDAHGGPEAHAAVEAYTSADIDGARQQTAAETLSVLVDTSMLVGEVADVIGVSRSRVLRRIADRDLYAFPLLGRRYVPRWQFTPAVDEASTPGRWVVLPGLSDVVPAIPGHVHPLSLHAWMTTPSRDFDDLSPVAFLATGGPTAPVVDWLIGWKHAL